MKYWLKDIRDKMGDFEMKAPDGLWDRLALVPQPSADAGRRHHSKFWAWSCSLAGAAAVMVALVFFNHSLHDGINQDVTLSDVHEEDVYQANREPAAAMEEDSSTKAAVGTCIAGIKVCSDPVAPDGSSSRESLRDVPVQDNPADAEICERNGDIPDVLEIFPDDNTSSWLAMEDNKTKSRRLSLSFHQSINAPSNTSMSHSGVELLATGPQNADWNDSPLLGMMTYNRGSESRKLSHRMPVRVGVSVGYQITDRWSAESGITYTHLASDIRQGGNTGTLHGVQRLNYIGIPAAVRYSAYRNRLYDVYASAGLNLDLCVSGRSETAFMLNGHSSSKIERYDEHPLQASVSVSAGMAFQLTPSISLYAEPGVSCYFDDGSNIQTIYKSRPLNFSMNAGLRFMVGKSR